MVGFYGLTTRAIDFVQGLPPDAATAARQGTGMLMNKRLENLKLKLDELADKAEHDCDSASPEEEEALKKAVKNFKAAGPEILDEATKHLWSYYRCIAGMFSAKERADYGFPEIEREDDVWDHVEIDNPPSVGAGDGDYEPAPSYLSFEGEVAWEPEHGLELVFEEGARVCKVGAFDGHFTNASAFADKSLLGVIYK